MDAKVLKSKIIAVMKSSHLASLATVYDNKPWVRYMAVKNDDITLYTTTFLQSRKVMHIKQNNQVQVIIRVEQSEWSAPYISIEGTAEILTDASSKKKCWSDELKQFFSGVDDPNYAVIKIVPQRIEYFNVAESHEPQVYTEAVELPYCEKSITAEDTRLNEDLGPCDDYRESL